MAGAERLGVGGARFRRWRPAESAAEARACRSRRDAPRGTPASISSSGLLVRHGLSEVSGRVVSARAGTTVAGVQLPVDQAAFMDIITVDSVAEAPAVFAKWGVVRVRNLLSQEEVTTLLNAAKDYGVRRDAFAQDSQSDRYTLWIAGDGMSEEQLAATKSIKENVPCIEKAIFHEDDSSWRPVCDAFGYPNLMLAEVVTSTPGGAPQDWHFDGEGITAQVSLVQIDASNGPTEIQPRPVPKAYMQWMKHLSNEAPGKSKDDMAAVLAELTTEIKMMYDRLSKAHEFAWNTLRPILGNNVAVARSIIEAGLTPPVVHMVADVGTLTLYDAAMIHRGGGSAPSRLVSLSLSLVFTTGFPSPCILPPSAVGAHTDSSRFHLHLDPFPSCALARTAHLFDSLRNPALVCFQARTEGARSGPFLPSTSTRRTRPRGSAPASGRRPRAWER